MCSRIVNMAVLGSEENMGVGVLHVLWPRVSVPLSLICTGAAPPTRGRFYKRVRRTPRECG